MVIADRTAAPRVAADRHLALLRTRGYSRMPGLIGPDEVGALRLAIDRLLAEDDGRFGADRLNAAGQRGAVRNLADRGRAFERALGLTAIHRLAGGLLGPEYRLHSFDALVLQPGEGRFPWDFHTDLHALRTLAFPAATSPGVNFLLAVDDAGPANGATWVVPASHRATVAAPDVTLLAELAEQPALDAGDALVFDARLWHCAGYNATRASRRLIKIEFAQPWLRGQMDYPRAVRPEVLARLDLSARTAIGAPLAASVQELLINAECGS
jgi:hypothetical protein